jgi:hypothetical protein
MSKFSVPFKTNVNRPFRLPATKPSSRPARARKVNDGYWFTPRHPITAYLVNEKKERKKLFQWILIWVAVIPLSFMIIVWLVLLFADLFAS